MSFLRFSPEKDRTDHSAAGRAIEGQDRVCPDADDALALARAIHGAGMSGVAAFALQVLKPLHWMGGQAMWVLQPFVEALGAGSRSGKRTGTGILSAGGVARLLEREGGLDELTAHLEQLQREQEGSGV